MCRRTSLSRLSRPALEALLVELFGKVAVLEKTIVATRRDRPSERPEGPPHDQTERHGPSNRAAEAHQNAEARFRSKVTPRVSIEEQVANVAGAEGSRFKGHEPFLVQDLVISARATCYQRECWITPDGQTILAPLPEGGDGHFGPGLGRFVLMQYHQGQSTLPRLAALLRSVGVSISQRQLQRLLTDKQESFAAEARDVLRAGLETSPYVSVNDTGVSTPARMAFVPGRQ